ncbi:MAG: hypothetical protein CFE33_14345 [Pseudorhodobacter sp. PARRP1]|nr:MAG: hypothetical protein CFE33_14345 [Pseudorhodobacter sp. PARRP1]
MDQIIAAATGELVIARAAVQRVIASAARASIIAVAVIDHIIIAETVDEVIAILAVYGVGPIGAEKSVIALRAVDVVLRVGSVGFVFIVRTTENETQQRQGKQQQKFHPGTQIIDIEPDLEGGSRAASSFMEISRKIVHNFSVMAELFPNPR